MRQALSNSRSDYLTLNEEISFLKNYLELEENRFKNKFAYEIRLENGIAPDELFIPPMLVQPYVENAIIHGIGNKKEFGNLLVEFYCEEDKCLICRVKDDGVGRNKAKELKKLRSGVSDHTSVATSLTETRLNILNQLEDHDFEVQVTDLKDEDGQPAGTEVLIRMPYLLDY